MVATPINSETSAIGEGTDRLEVICEVKRTSQRKSTSLDQVYQAVFETDDPRLMSLSTLPADVTVKLIVEVNNV